MGKILSAFIQNNTPFKVVVKSQDETIDTDTVMSNDSELKFVAKANRNYTVYFLLAYNSGTTPDIKTAVAIPSGTARRVDDDWASKIPIASADWTTPLLTTGGAEDIFYQPIGLIKIGVTGGGVNLQWAQNTSDASDTTMLKGSLMVVYES